MAKLTNEQKYKTPEERIKAFRNHCNPIVGNCGTRCRLSEPDKSGGYDMMNCFAHWLTLEAELVKPMDCPFCGGKCRIRRSPTSVNLACDCGYHSPFRVPSSNGFYSTDNEAIAAHNRVCRAVKAAKESEANHA